MAGEKEDAKELRKATETSMQLGDSAPFASFEVQALQRPILLKKWGF